MTLSIRKKVAFLLFAAAASGTVTTDASAAPIIVTKQQNNIETSSPAGGPHGSAFFTQSYDGAVTFGPQFGFSGSVAAGTSANTTSSGTVSVIGNSTSAGNWIDGNGIPTGITLSFNATFTVSTPTPGSYLTLNTTLGNGIGIAQSTGVAGNNNIGEILNISALSLSSINFAGTLAESGFSFMPGTVSNAKWNRFRSNNFPEATAGMTVGVGTDTWGFGTSSGNQASGLFIGNNYNETVGFSTGGPLELTTTAGTGWNLKGIAFQYDASYEISVIPEPTTSTLALVGGFALLAMRRRAA